MSSAEIAPPATGSRDSRRRWADRVADTIRATSDALSGVYARIPRMSQVVLALLILGVAATAAGVGIVTLVDLLHVRSWAR